MAVVPFPKSNPRTQDTLSVVYALCLPVSQVDH